MAGEYNQTIEDKEVIGEDRTAKGNDDNGIEDISDKDAKDVANEMNKQNPDNKSNADTPGDESDDELFDEETSDEEEESENDESDEEKSDEDATDKDAATNEGESDKDTETPATESKKEAGEESAFSQPAADKAQEIESDANLSAAEKENRLVRNLYEQHKDILPETFIKNWDKFIESDRSKTFLHLDDSLHKLVVNVGKFDQNLPLSERLNLAFDIAFGKEIVAKKTKQAERQGEVKAEIRTQKVGKAAGSPVKTSTAKAKSSLDGDQQTVMSKMGVKQVDTGPIKFGGLEF